MIFVSCTRIAIQARCDIGHHPIQLLCSSDAKIKAKRGKTLPEGTELVSGRPGPEPGLVFLSHSVAKKGRCQASNPDPPLPRMSLAPESLTGTELWEVIPQHKGRGRSHCLVGGENPRKSATLCLFYKTHGLCSHCFTQHLCLIVFKTTIL